MKILNGDSLEILKTLESESVDCIVTSPPYYGLRDYGTGSAQIGLEETPEMFVEKLTAVFHECKRVLKDSGTLWLNIGDTYNSATKNIHATSPKQLTNRGSYNGNITKHKSKSCKQKDLIGVPWLLAFALRSDGWYLRQDIIWAKPNPMPESVTDRCTKSHEYIFLLTKQPKYYFNHDAIQEKAISDGNITNIRFGGNKYGDNDDIHFATKSGKTWNPKYKNLDYNGQSNHTMHERRADGEPDKMYLTRNKRDVWNVATQPNKEAHFATFPEKLIEPCILAGCPKGGTVLDPFCGSGTTGIVSVRHERDFIGIELNLEYVEMSERRIRKEQEQGIQLSIEMGAI